MKLLRGVLITEQHAAAGGVAGALDSVLKREVGDGEGAA